MPSNDMQGVVSDDIESKVIKVTMEVLSLDGPPPSLDSRVSDDLGADSIDLFSLVSALEDEFGGAIDEDDMDAMSTLQDVVDYIRKARAGMP